MPMLSTRLVAACGAVSAACSCVSAMASPPLARPAIPGGTLTKGLPAPIEPTMVRGVRYSDGRLIATTEWKDYRSLAHQEATFAYAFDSYESVSGLPGEVPNSGRYLYGADYTAPRQHADMTVAAGFEGAVAKRADLVFMIGKPGDPGGNVAFFYTLLTTEEAPCAAPSGVYDGIQASFSPEDGLYFANLDVSADPTLGWTLPVDGAGGYLILLTQDEEGQVLALGQTGLWFTGEKQTPPEPRAGTNNPVEASDNSGSTCSGPQPDGTIQFGCECYDYTTKAPEGTAFSSCVGFGVIVDGGCNADCDESGSLSIDDFVCFQTLYAIQDPLADCDQSGSLNVDDFICFQTIYAIGC